MSIPANVQGGTQQANGAWKLPNQTGPGPGMYYDPNRSLYYMLDPGSGKQTYISPVAFGGQGGNKATLLHDAQQWDTKKGEWDSSLNWGNILSMAAGGMMAAPAIGAAVGAVGAGGPAAAATTTTATKGLGSTFGSMLLPALGRVADFAGNAWATNRQLSANDRAAQTQADAALKVAELQANAAREQLAYLKEQADREFGAQESAQRANYDMWASDRQQNYDIWNADRQTSYDKWVADRQHDYDKYASRETNLAPYRGIGQGATTRMSELLGVPIVPQPKTAALPQAFLTPAPLSALPPYPGGGAQSHGTTPDVEAKAHEVFSTAGKGLPPTSASLDMYLKALNDAGIKAVRATHGAGHKNGVGGPLQSDDKIILPGGQVVDLIRDVGGRNAAWLW